MTRTDPPQLLSAETIRQRIRTLAAEINTAYPAGRDPHLVSVLKGGFVFLVDLMRALARPVTVDFVAMASYGAETRPASPPRMIKDLDHEIDDRDVLVVEDIVDTGRTLSGLLDTLRARHPRSLRTVTLLDKEARRTVPVRVDHVGFTIEDLFVVGYGLDYAEQYRHLPYVGVLAGTDGDESAS